MNSNLFLTVIITLFTSILSFADGPITLKADSGENIKIWYGLAKIPDNGNTATSFVTGVHVIVDNGNSNTKIVLINNCSPSNSYSFEPRQTVYICNYGSDGSWVNATNCSVQGYYEADTITTYAANHGGALNCTQQIAVSNSFNNWLKVKNSYEHNFNFSFPVL